MIIFDLDGTLADCEHRRHFVDKSYLTCGGECSEFKRCLSCLRKLENDQPDWKAFYEACDQDKPIKQTIGLFRTLCFKERKEIEIWSGRCESTRDKTMSWLYEYIFGYFEPCKVRMRPIGDSTPDDVLKERWLDEYLQTMYPQLDPNAPSGTEYSRKDPIEFVFDDRPKVIRMWRRRGIFIFDCNQTGKEF